jgi:Cu-Zn family superoxide dismutase
MSFSRSLAAVAELFIDGVGPSVGYVEFLQESPDEDVFVTVNLHDIPEGGHGFHIHQYGDMSRGCESMDPHYNPENTVHGGRSGFPRHPGDMGNVWSGPDQLVTESFYVPVDLNEVIGRGLVLHEGLDDLGRGGNLESLETGNAGGRYACGLILPKK